MKILFICCAGMSSSLVVRKLQNHIEDLKKSEKIKTDIIVDAIPLDKFRNNLNDYDLILLAPQIAYKLKEFKKIILLKDFKVPISVVHGRDYGLIKVEKILEDALSLINNFSNN